jgi:alkylation response protein AidB-like acyl-CoA dehydrogenase
MVANPVSSPASSSSPASAPETAVSVEPGVGGGFLLEPAGSRAVFTPEMLNEEQRMMKDTADEFMRKEVEPHIADIEAKKPGLMPALLRKAGALGLLGHDVPEDDGGLGGTMTGSSLIAESVSRMGSFAVSYGAHVGIGTMPLVYFGTPEQRRRYLPRLASGELLAAYALTEPTAGSDALAAKTTAHRTPDGTQWKLNGQKQFITNAGFADLFTVFAKVDGTEFSAFLVERTAPGLTVGPEEHKLGIRGSSTCALFFEDCLVPADAVLGTIGAGHKIAFNILNLGRWTLAAGAVGAAKVCLEQGVAYAKERQQFGKPIAEFDLIRKKIGDAATQVYVCESMTCRTSGLLDARVGRVDRKAADAQKQLAAAVEEHSIEASIIKVFGSEMLFTVADETLQIFGGAGYIADYPVERISRDARINRIFEGTNEINRLIVPGTVLKRAMQGRLALMELVSRVQEEMADPAKIDRTVPDGPLGVERQKCEYAKRAVAWSASLGVQKYMNALTDKQELLGVLADCIIQIYAMDSAIARTLQMVRARGEEACAIPLAMTQLFCAASHEKVLDLLREMLMWMSEAQEFADQVRDINSYYSFTRVNTFSLRRRIAKHVIERGGYSLE